MGRLNLFALFGQRIGLRQPEFGVKPQWSLWKLFERVAASTSSPDERSVLADVGFSACQGLASKVPVKLAASVRAPSFTTATAEQEKLPDAPSASWVMSNSQ